MTEDVIVHDHFLQVGRRANNVVPIPVSDPTNEIKPCQIGFVITIRLDPVIGNLQIPGFLPVRTKNLFDTFHF